MADKPSLGGKGGFKNSEDTKVLVQPKLLRKSHKY